MHMNRSRQNIHVTKVVEGGKTKLRIKTNVTCQIEEEDDLRHIGGTAMGKDAGATVISQTVGQRLFISARWKKTLPEECRAKRYLTAIQKGKTIYYTQISGSGHECFKTEGHGVKARQKWEED